VNAIILMITIITGTQLVVATEKAPRLQHSVT
jgi:hypothetical protein